MKTLGILGGMSWASTLEYYKLANEHANRVLGGHHSAKIILLSVNFADIHEFQKNGEWELAGKALSDAALKIELAGASVLVLATNTMHNVADTIQQKLNIPFLHIADSLGKAMLASRITRIALLGTKFTMEMDFYQKYLLKYGISCITPTLKERDALHAIIFDELVFNTVTTDSKEFGRSLAFSLKERGAQGIALACTELRMLLSANDSDLPVFDTTFQHITDAMTFCLSSQ